MVAGLLTRWDGWTQLHDAVKDEVHLRRARHHMCTRDGNTSVLQIPSALGRALIRLWQSLFSPLVATNYSTNWEGGGFYESSLALYS